VKGKNMNVNKEKENKKKSFIAKVFEKLDKKMLEKAKSNTCSCKPGDNNNSCCS